MAQQADGTVYINSSIDTNGVETGGKRFESAFKRVANTAKTAVGSIRSGMKSINQAISAGFDDSGFYTIQDRIDAITDHLKTLESQGFGFGDAEYDQTYQELVLVEDELKRYKVTLAETARAENQAVQAGQQTQGHFIRLKSILSSITSGLKKAGAAMLLFHKNTKKSNSSISSGIKNMLKYTLGISSLLVLFRKIKSAVKEGMQNLAQYSSKTNTHLSALKSSMTQLKNSLATAFNPILTVIEPILTRFINLLSQAATYVGMFFASLTGQTTFTKAVAVWEDYANSIGAAADNAKKALKYLSGLDEIRTFTEDKDTGYVAPTPEEMFETVPIESKIKEFADKIKQTLSEMFAPLKKSWEKYGGYIKQSFHNLIIDLLNGDFFDAGKDASHLISGIFNFFTDAIGNVDWEGIGNKIGEFLSGIDWMQILSSVGDFIWTAINAGIDLWKGAFYAAPIETAIISALAIAKFTGIGSAITEAFKNALTRDLAATGGLISIVAGLTVGIENISAILSGEYKNASFASAIKTAISGLLVGVGAALMTGAGIAIPLGVILSFLITDVVVNWENYKKKWSVTQEGFKNLLLGDWKTAMDDFQAALLAQMEMDNIFNTVSEKIVDAIFGEGTWANALQIIQSDNSVIRKLGEYVTEGFKAGVIAPFANMQNWIKENIVDPFVGFLKKLFGIHSPSTVLKQIGIYLMQGLLNGITSLFASVKNKFDTLKTTIISVFTNLRTSISSIWNGISSIVKNNVNSIIGFMNSMISGIVSGINTMINAMNALHFDVPDWVPVLGGKSFGFNIPAISAPQIPYLASGAVIPPNAPFMAVLGDQKHGTNVEAPLSMIEDAVVSAMSKAGNNLNGVTIRVPVYINNRQVMEAVVEAAKLQQTVSGVNPLAFT